MTAELPNIPSVAPAKTVPLSTLHHRIANELSELANICAAVENALGDIIEHPETTLGQPIVTLQGLDRLRQSLEDIARLSRVLSVKKNAGEDSSISLEIICETVVLSGLSDRLTRAETFAATETTAHQDVFWTNN